MGLAKDLGRVFTKDSVNIPQDVKRKANVICTRYNGWKLPQEIGRMWKELDTLGIEVLITGLPNAVAPGGKRWAVDYDYKGERVDNSKFIYSVYSGNKDSLKDEYMMYFS